VEVWLTGDAVDAGILTEHWDGSTRRTVATVSPANAWAVGWATAADESGEFTGLLDHWDGAMWKAVPLPAGAPVAVLHAVTAVSAHDVWAVGFDAGDQPVLLRYDGARWQQLPQPSIDGLYGELNAVTAEGAGDVWVVGRVVNSRARRYPAIGGRASRSR
jgi:hypothetical protein